jgi:hypothetical protein
MHLEITAQSLRPFRMRCENHTSLRSRKKIAADPGSFGFLARRFVDPSAKLFCNIGADAMQLGQRTPRRYQVARKLRPEKALRAARRKVRTRIPELVSALRANNSAKSELEGCAGAITKSHRCWSDKGPDF